MKCLSLQQPWATLVLLGVKRYETRGWSTLYRGPLAIHASKVIGVDEGQLFYEEPIYAHFRHAGYRSPVDLPRGRLLGQVELLDCVPTQQLGPISALERMLGDFGPARFAWKLAHPKLLDVPIVASGRPGLFDLPQQSLVISH